MVRTMWSATQQQIFGKIARKLLATKPLKKENG